MVPRDRVVDASLLMSAVSRKEPLDGRLTHGPGVRLMSTDTSVPQPRVAGPRASNRLFTAARSFSAAVTPKSSALSTVLAAASAISSETAAS